MSWRATPWMDQQIGEWQEDSFRLLDVYSVAITNECGKRMMYTGPLETDTKEKAERVARLINTYISFHPLWEPRDKYWGSWYPSYGSEEYQSSGEEQVWAAQERAMDPFYYDPRLPYVSR